MGEQLRLVAVHPGIDVDRVRESTGWDLDVADNVVTIEPPSRTELELLRRDVDPQRVYQR